MRFRLVTLIAAGLAFAGPWAIARAAGPAPAKDASVATVNGESITESELSAGMQADAFAMTVAEAKVKA